MHGIEREILELPCIFVNENDKQYPYNRGYTMSGLPYYAAPYNKHGEPDLNVSVEEFIFLPITPKEFAENKTDLFYGYRFILSSSGFTSLSLMQMPQSAVTRTQLTYDINRIRYYPEGEKSIVIDRLCDNLIPPQIVTLQFPSLEVGQRMLMAIADVLNSYCNFYVDRKV
jgi:hypothetical protein